jgi:hypothetical protein
MSWKALYSSLKHIPAVGTPVRKPTDVEYNEFEKATGFRLPKSYKEFAKVFGAGELGNYYSIRAPGCAVEGATSFNRQADLAFFNKSLREKDDQLWYAFVKEQYRGDADRISRLVCFADNATSELIAWDPEDVRDKAGPEYGIYIIIREEDHSKLLATSFPLFIEEVCFGIGYFKLFDESIDDVTDAPPKSFQPVGYRNN